MRGGLAWCACVLRLCGEQATDCTSAVRIKDSFDASSFCTDVLCSHNHPWCFNCMDEPHAPADCTQVKDWRKKCAVSLGPVDELGVYYSVFITRCLLPCLLPSNSPEGASYVV